MKNLYVGFYLSPNGEHIIELKKNTKNQFLIDVYGHDGFNVDFWFDIFKLEAMIIFSSWSILK